MREIKGNVILITGAAGFIASHVADYLLETYGDIQVVIYDKLDYCANLKNIADNDRCSFVCGDICDLDLVRDTLRQHGVTMILHFAAQSHVDNSILDPIKHTTTNCIGTQVLLEAARTFQDSLKLFVHVSTDEVYGGEGGHLDESTRFNPTNPYSASKAAAECIVNAYYKTFNLPLIVTRANNIYGPRQFPEKVIPKFSYRLLRQMPCCLHGGGKTVRHFLYVKDVCEAFDTILRKGELGQVYNIGADEEFSMTEVADYIIDRMIQTDILPASLRSELIIEVEDRKFNDQRYFVKDERLRALGWKPRTSFREGIRLTVDWYVGNPHYWKNIERYLEPHPKI